MSSHRPVIPGEEGTRSRKPTLPFEEETKGRLLFYQVARDIRPVSELSQDERNLLAKWIVYNLPDEERSRLRSQGIEIPTIEELEGRRSESRQHPVLDFLSQTGQSFLRELSGGLYQPGREIGLVPSLLGGGAAFGAALSAPVVRSFSPLAKAWDLAGTLTRMTGVTRPAASAILRDIIFGAGWFPLHTFMEKKGGLAGIVRGEPAPTPGEMATSVATGVTLLPAVSALGVRLAWRNYAGRIARRINENIAKEAEVIMRSGQVGREEAEKLAAGVVMGRIRKLISDIKAGKIDRQEALNLLGIDPRDPVFVRVTDVAHIAEGILKNIAEKGARAIPREISLGAILRMVRRPEYAEKVATAVREGQSAAGQVVSAPAAPAAAPAAQAPSQAAPAAVARQRASKKAAPAQAQAAQPQPQAQTQAQAQATTPAAQQKVSSPMFGPASVSPQAPPPTPVPRPQAPAAQRARQPVPKKAQQAQMQAAAAQVPQPAAQPAPQVQPTQPPQAVTRPPRPQRKQVQPQPAQQPAPAPQGTAQAAAQPAPVQQPAAQPPTPKPAPAQQPVVKPTPAPAQQAAPKQAPQPQQQPTPPATKQPQATQAAAEVAGGIAEARVPEATIETTTGRVIDVWRPTFRRITVARFKLAQGLQRSDVIEILSWLRKHGISEGQEVIWAHKPARIDKIEVAGRSAQATITTSEGKTVNIPMLIVHTPKEGEYGYVLLHRHLRPRVWGAYDTPSRAAARDFIALAREAGVIEPGTPLRVRAYDVFEKPSSYVIDSPVGRYAPGSEIAVDPSGTGDVTFGRVRAIIAHKPVYPRGKKAPPSELQGKPLAVIIDSGGTLQVHRPEHVVAVLSEPPPMPVLAARPPAAPPSQPKPAAQPTTQAQQAPKPAQQAKPKPPKKAGPAAAPQTAAPKKKASGTATGTTKDALAEMIRSLAAKSPPQRSTAVENMSHTEVKAFLQLLGLTPTKDVKQNRELLLAAVNQAIAARGGK